MHVVLLDWWRDLKQPLGSSGMTDIVWSVGRRLAAQGEEVTVLAPYGLGEMPEASRTGVRLVQVPVPNILYRNVVGHSAIVLRLRAALLRLRNVDLLHVAEYLSSGIIAPTCRRVPVVLTVPGNVYQRIAQGTNLFDPVTTLVYKQAARLTARHCAAVLATSEEMRSWWKRTGTPEARLQVLPLGVETDVFYPRPGARERLGISPDECMALFVGHLRPDNGPENALRAVARAARANPRLRLHVVGDGPQKARLHELAGELGVDQAVTWHGWRKLDELPELFSAADLFVFPRLSAVTPRVLLQAMACGAPVVTSAIGGLDELVRDGETGLLADPRDVESLAATVLRLAEDRQLAESLAARARRFVVEQLSWDAVVRELRERIYPPLLQQPVAVIR